MTRLSPGAATDVGRVRASNQDNLLVAEADDLFAVADGMGGHQGGEEASAVAVAALRAAYRGRDDADGLVESVRRANSAVWQRSREDPALSGMGTTLTAAALVRVAGEERLAVTNVGDSRAYLFRDGQLTQLTDDDSLVGEMVRKGELTEEEAAVHPNRHVLTRALGMDPDLEVGAPVEVLPRAGDRLLLCSDGLFNELGEPDITAVLRRLPDPGEAARELVARARTAGGSDNITVVVVDVVDDDQASVRASAALADTAATRVTPAVRATPAPGPADEATSSARRDAQLSALETEFDPDEREVRPAEELALPARRVSLRAVAFVVALLAVLGVAAGAVAWYARGSYYVGLDGDQVVVYRGRPGGLLWFEPTVAEATTTRRSDLVASRVEDLEAGVTHASLDDARRYLANLREEAALARTPAPATTAPTTTAPTTTAPPPVATTTPAPPPTGVGATPAPARALDGSLLPSTTSSSAP